MFVLSVVLAVFDLEFFEIEYVFSGIFSGSFVYSCRGLGFAWSIVFRMGVWVVYWKS